MIQIPCAIIRSWPDMARCVQACCLLVANVTENAGAKQAPQAPPHPSATPGVYRGICRSLRVALTAGSQLASQQVSRISCFEPASTSGAFPCRCPQRSACSQKSLKEYSLEPREWSLQTAEFTARWAGSPLSMQGCCQTQLQARAGLPADVSATLVEITTSLGEMPVQDYFGFSKSPTTRSAAGGASKGASCFVAESLGMARSWFLAGLSSDPCAQGLSAQTR